MYSWLHKNTGKLSGPQFKAHRLICPCIPTLSPLSSNRLANVVAKGLSNKVPKLQAPTTGCSATELPCLKHMSKLVNLRPMYVSPGTMT